MKKTLLFKRSPKEKHWVGDGFYVSTLISPDPSVYSHFDPFVLLDYAAPKKFEPSSKQRGVGEHPHRGFETVTFAYQGEISHRDSGGGGGTIKKGGVQWMTAAKGVVHEELFSKAFSKSGGVLEMVQLWVNLPAKDKMTEPAYQDVEDKDFPKIELVKNVNARLIAGKYKGQKGPCKTHTPITILDLRYAQDQKVNIELKENTNTLCLVLQGKATIESDEINQNEIAVLSNGGKDFELQAVKDTKVLVLNGQPINEPIVAHGPFVMNSKDEIIKAIDDFKSGKMGRLK